MHAPHTASEVVDEANGAPILAYLHGHGQSLDTEIAKATGIPLVKVRSSLSRLSARGDISTCSVIRFIDEKRIEGTLCRIAGTIPASSPGRKPGTPAA